MEENTKTLRESIPIWVTIIGGFLSLLSTGAAGHAPLWPLIFSLTLLLVFVSSFYAIVTCSVNKNPNRNKLLYKLNQFLFFISIVLSIYIWSLIN